MMRWKTHCNSQHCPLHAAGHTSSHHLQNSRAREASSQHHCPTGSPVPGRQARVPSEAEHDCCSGAATQDAPEVAGPFPTLPASSDPFGAAPSSTLQVPLSGTVPDGPALLPQTNPEPGTGPPRGGLRPTRRQAVPVLAHCPGPPGDSRPGAGGEVTGDLTPEPTPLSGADRDLPSYCKSTRTSKKGNTEPRRLVTEPGATMSEGAAVAARKTRERAHQPPRAPRLQLRPPKSALAQASAAAGAHRREAAVGGAPATLRPGAAAVQSPSSWAPFDWARPGRGSR